MLNGMLNNPNYVSVTLAVVGLIGGSFVAGSSPSPILKRRRHGNFYVTPIPARVTLAKGSYEIAIPSLTTLYEDALVVFHHRVDGIFVFWILYDCDGIRRLVIRFITLRLRKTSRFCDLRSDCLSRRNNHPPRPRRFVNGSHSDTPTPSKRRSIGRRIYFASSRSSTVARRTGGAK